jgi:hypothetical protein
MMTIIRRAEQRERVEHDLYFEWEDQPGSGFAFPCDPQGRVDPTVMLPAQRRNYERCRSGELPVLNRGVRTHRFIYQVPALGRCRCGAEVALDGPDNLCGRCGRAYSQAGQLLAGKTERPELDDPLGCWQEDLVEAR